MAYHSDIAYTTLFTSSTMSMETSASEIVRCYRRKSLMKTSDKIYILMLDVVCLGEKKAKKGFNSRKFVSAEMRGWALGYTIPINIPI